MTKSWTTTDPWVAIEAVKDEMGIADTEDERWGVAPPSGGAGSSSAELPEDYVSGVLADDVLAGLVESAPDRTEIVELLASIGYKAASLPVEKDETCTLETKLDALASRANDMVSTGDVTRLTLAPSAMTCEILVAAPMGPAPTKPAKPATAPAWSPPGTVPTAPAWTPGGYPVPAPAAPAWSCRTVTLGSGGTNCICSQIQQWGRWETTWCWYNPFASCVEWHVIEETRTCTTLNTACPAGGPPADEQNCNSSY